MLILVMGSYKSFATVYTVSTKTDLQTKMAAALPGDTVIVVNGSYNWGQIAFTNNNGTSASAWIVLKAESLGGVVFTGSTYLQFKGTRVMVDGFTFKNGSAGTNAIVSFRNGSGNLANYCRISRTTFDNYNTYSADSSTENEWVGIYGTYNRVDHCTFINKYNARATVVVWYSSATYPAPAVSTYHRIDSNYFAGRSYMGANGGETIRIGDSNGSRTNGFNTIEYNLFENCTQNEPEIISNKSNFNVYRYNTFKNCNGGLTLRHGRYCSVYSNFFIVSNPAFTQSYGIRAIDKGHKIYNNYLEGLLGNSSGGSSQLRAPINLYNGLSTDTTDAAAASGYFPADSCIVAFNTIVNCKGGGGIVLGGTGGGTIQPKGIVLANNLVKMNTGTALYRNSSNTALTYFSEGNMYQAPSGLGETTTGWQSATLNFGARFDGILKAPSLVTDASVNGASYNALLNSLDVKGVSRVNTFDVGCEELNGSGSAANHPLDSSEVGAGPHAAVVLPVRLLTFSAQPQGEQIVLTWTVASEQNVSHYQVETATGINAFEPVAVINANGVRAYQHTFKANEIARYYFRLKMIDADGKFAYSNVITTEVKQQVSVQLYPNPAAEKVFIKLQERNSAVTVLFININGQVVKKIAAASTGLISISTSDLANGFYRVQVLNESKIIYKQPLLIHHSAK